MTSQPFAKMEEILENLLKPVAMMLREADPDDKEQQFMLKTVEYAHANMEESIDVARNRGKKFVWYEFCLSPELFYVFDLYPFMGEAQPGAYSTLRQDFIGEFIDAAEDSGIPPEVCSIDKVLVGAALMDELPTPDLIITTSAPCDSSRTGYQILEKLFDSPVIKIDAPFSDDADAMKYYGEQIRSLIPELEKLSGIKFDIDRLREVVEESNRAIEYIYEWNMLRRLKPCPTPGSLLLTVLGATVSNIGKPRTTEYCKWIYDYARERADNGIETNEKIRVIWQHVPSLFDATLFQWMQDEFGAVVVDDMLSSYLRQPPIDTTSLDTMLVGLANRGLNMTMGRLRLPAPVYVDDFVNAYHDFSGDCAILSAHHGCKHCWGAINLVRDAARSEDIPLLVFDFDFLDSRITSAENVKNKVEQFFRTMEL
jgi:benzoyl-CoA reductase/2-hydroxyglutaryl-CoA dehydratase subunit BcrC/BadD/HgdB